MEGSMQIHDPSVPPKGADRCVCDIEMAQSWPHSPHTCSAALWELRGHGVILRLRALLGCGVPPGVQDAPGWG